MIKIVNEKYVEENEYYCKDNFEKSVKNAKDYIDQAIDQLIYIKENDLVSSFDSHFDDKIEDLERLKEALTDVIHKVKG